MGNTPTLLSQAEAERIVMVTTPHDDYYTNIVKSRISSGSDAFGRILRKSLKRTASGIRGSVVVLVEYDHPSVDEPELAEHFRVLVAPDARVTCCDGDGVIVFTVDYPKMETPK